MLILVVLAAFSAAALVHAQRLRYPPTPKGDVVDDYFGTKVADPYRWMEDLDSKAVAEWIAAQNAVTFRYLDSLPVRDALKARITELWNYPKVSVPFIESPCFSGCLMSMNIMWKPPGLSSTVSPGLMVKPSVSGRIFITPSVIDISCSST